MKKTQSLLFHLLSVFLSVGLLYFLMITLLATLVVIPIMKNLDEAVSIDRHDGVLNVVEGELESLRITSKGISDIIMADSQSPANEMIGDVMKAFEIDFLALPPAGWTRNGERVTGIPDVGTIFPDIGSVGRSWTFLTINDADDIYIAFIDDMIVARRIDQGLRDYGTSAEGAVVNLRVSDQSSIHAISAIDLNDRIIFNPVTPDTILFDWSRKGLVSTTYISPGSDRIGLAISIESPSSMYDIGRTSFIRIIILDISLFVFILGPVLAWLVLRVTRPMKRLIAGIEEWDGLRLPDFGRLSERNDELGLLAKTFTRMAGVIRSKTRSLEEQAIRDGLTGLLNRRRFDQTLRTEWDRAQREEDPLSMVMADVDDFKAYNDIYGHQEGDECLRLVALACGRAAQRPGDLPFRYGGEEFALILSGTDTAGAVQVAERIRRTMETMDIPHSGNPREGRVTISLGVATASVQSGMSREDLVRAADKALYRAKQSGRNRVVSN